MFRFVRRKICAWQDRLSCSDGRVDEVPVTGDLETNLEAIRRMLGPSTDVVTRRFEIASNKSFSAALVFVDSLADKVTISESIMRPLMFESSAVLAGTLKQSTLLEMIEPKILALGEVKRENSVDQIVQAVLGGDTVLLVNGVRQGLVLATKKWEARSVEEPQTEIVVRGPREGFNEVLRTNISLLRRRIQSTELTVDSMVIGRRTRTRVSVVYIKDVANPKLVKEVRLRLQRIKADSILESGYIEQLIEDAPFSPFATVGNSEKPDVVAAKLLEGRVAVLTDGTPFALTVPYLFVEGFLSQDDYYSRPYYVTMVRWFRYAAYTASIIAPSAWILLLSYHPELLPTPLLITIASGVERLPLPSFWEVALMGFIFETLREAGIRLPRAVGQAVSIVGALVIGQAAVAAGFVSPGIVVVTALTAISSFAVPPHIDSSVALRTLLVLLTGVMGAYGLMMGILYSLIHLASIRSFGAPYLSPLAPLTPAEFVENVAVRSPLWLRLTKPRAIAWGEPQPAEHLRVPSPPPEDDSS